MIKPALRLVIFCTLLITMVGFWLLGFAHQHLDRSVVLGQEGSMAWTIDKGTSISRVTRQLYNNKIISHPRVLSIYAKLADRTSIQAGSYLIESSDSARTLLEKFNRGNVILHQITFPEGWSFKQWLAHLAKVEQFAKSANADTAAILEAAGLEL